MNNVLFGDTFNIITQFLLPIELYQLSQSCKKYNQLITENVIKNSTIDEMRRRLCVIFGDNFIEFMQILQDTDATIVGSFITQCMLGETWTDTDISICIEGCVNTVLNISESDDEETIEEKENILSYPTHTENITKIIKFMEGNGYVMEIPRYPKFIDIDILLCMINQTKIKLIPLHDTWPHKNPMQYINTYYDCDLNKNMYKITRNELYIRTIHEIFAKCANINSSRGGERLNKKTISKLYNHGFRFYKFDNHKRILSDADIHRLSCNIIKINGKKSRDGCEKIIDRYKNFIINRDAIQHVMVCGNTHKTYLVFNIDTTSPYYANIKETIINKAIRLARICKCTHDKTSRSCITKLLYPELEHYHCNYIKDDEYSSDEELILIPSYK